MKNNLYPCARLISLLFILIINTFSSFGQGLGPKTEARLQAAIEAIQNDPNKPFVGGMSVAVKVDELGMWQGATGYAARNVDAQNNLLPGGVPFTTSTLSRIYSVTKIFTAALVLELAQEGKFNLDDPISKYLPLNLINPRLNSAATIRQLLAHESGYSDYTVEFQLQLLVAALPTRIWAPAEAISFTNQIFPTGTQRRYSSTNYIVLGAMVEAITGKPIEQHYRERFFSPLGLESMFMGVREPIGNRGVLAAPHDNLSPFNPVFAQTGQPLFPNAYTNISRFPMTAIVSLAFAGGGIVSNAADLAEWGSALLSGRATSQATLDLMLNSFSATPDMNGNYLGYGIKIIPLLSENVNFIGHNGDAPGYRSLLAHQPERKLTVAVLTNFGGTDIYAIGKALYQALAPKFISFSPGQGVPGTMVTINGEGLATTTSVRFNGVEAAYAIISEDKIEAIVPATATTGPITLVTAGGTVASTEPFTVMPAACNLQLTTKVTQAEPWYGMWGAMNGAGAIDLTVTGGTAPYTYRWNAGVATQDLPTAVPGGFYSVTVTDANGCTGTTTTFVGRKNDFLRVLSSHSNVSTMGGSDGSIDLTVVGGVVPATYQWSNGATTEDLTGLSAGTYKVIVTDAFGRKATTTVIISEPGAPLSLSITHQNVSAAGKQDGAVDLTVVGGKGPYTYRWNTGAVTQDLHYALPGTYSVTVIDATGATATAMVRVEVGRMPVMMARKPAAGGDLLAPTTAGLQAYPNPVVDRATITFTLETAGKYSLDLYDIRGAKVKTIAAGQAQAQEALAVDLQTGTYAKGVYLLKLVTDKGAASKRLMVER